MKVLTPGYKYVAANFENRFKGQEIQFIEKRAKWADYPEDITTVNDGTTNEELLLILIDRIEFLDKQFASQHNHYALNHLWQALYVLQARTYDRQQRGVEGKAKL